MHFQKIEHIGIAVRQIDEAEALYTRLLGISPYKREVVEAEHVTTSFFLAGPNKIELLAPLDGVGPIQTFLDKKGEGIHHIAYAVDDILSEMRRLSAEGFQLLSQEPRQGADNKWVCFLHPKTTGGTLVELCQEMDEK